MKAKINIHLTVVIGIALLFLTIIIVAQNSRKFTIPDRHLVTKTGVCPPFYLYDEEGSLINPVLNINADKPYSTKKTCGKCHDYNKIT